MFNKRKKKNSIFILCMLIIVCFVMADLRPGMPLEVYAEETANPYSPDTATVLKDVRSYMLAKDTNPDFSSLWNVFDLMRSGLSVPGDYQDLFYRNVINYCKTNNWKITKNRYTDYSKLILGMTALGKNAQNLEGHNLLYYLSDFSNVKKQGFNGPVWALIALNSHPTYTIPVNKSAVEQTTEEGIIKYILDRETSKGGWALSGDNPDTDVTAMTIQSLASYYGSREDITAAVDRAISWLSSAQLPTGAFGTMGIETSESTSQVIVALSALGINCTTDSRFIKNGNSPMNGLYQYYLVEGGFMHVLPGAANNGGGSAGSIDGLATEQGMYATIAYERFLAGKTALYDMSDVEISPEGIVDEDPPSTEATTENKTPTTEHKENNGGSGSSNSGSSITVKASKVTLNYSQITVEKGKNRALTATVLPSNTSNKEISWKSADTKIATVTSSGSVKGIKAGTTTITVTTKDGSNVSESCKVIVTDTSVKQASGQTKSLGSSKASGSSKQLPAASNQGGSQTASGSGTADGTGEADASTESGWSFTGEDYVPKTYEETTEEGIAGEVDEVNSDTERSTSWADKSLTITIPLGPITYILLGMLILGGIEGIIWLIRKRRNQS